MLKYSFDQVCRLIFADYYETLIRYDDNLHHNQWIYLSKTKSLQGFLENKKI